VWARKIRQFVLEKYVVRTSVWMIDIRELGNRLSRFGFRTVIDNVRNEELLHSEMREEYPT
jgi:hypothetical protein